MPKTEKGRRTRDRIVEAAAGLMSEHGVARTSLDEVGAAAEVGRSQLYHYFADKDGLIDAVIEFQVRNVVEDRHLEQLDTFEGWTEWRDAVVAAKRRLRGVGGCPVCSLAAELAETDDRSRQVLDAGFERWEAKFRAGIEAMVAKGLLASDTGSAMLATMILAAFQGGMLLAQLRRDVAPLEAALDGALEHLRCHAV